MIRRVVGRRSVIRRVVGRRSVKPPRSRVTARVVGALVVVAAGSWLAPSGPARAGTQEPGTGLHPAVPGPSSPPAATSVAPGVQSGTDSITLLGQSPWVEGGHDFHLQLQITAHDPAHEQIVVQGYSQLLTRTGFDEALSGQINEYVVYSPTVALTKLPADPAGGVDVNIPVDPTNSAASTSSIPPFTTTAESGVFPLQIGLADDSGNPVGQPLTTFLVYAAGSEMVTELPPLSVALILPVHAAPVVDANGQLGTLQAGGSEALATLVNSLGNYPTVKVSLAVTPQTLDTLAAGSVPDRSTLGALVQLVGNGSDQVLPAPYTSVPFLGWQAAGLGTELTQQLDTGFSVLDGTFGSLPSATTWVVNGPLDQATLQTLISRGAKQIIVPDGELSALPAGDTETTFALPADLLGTGNTKVSVYGADVGLTADFSDAGGPVLAANQLLAELAMIQLETPGLTRGVAVLPPPGWSEDPTFVDTLLGGLADHPLLSSVTASGLFAAVQVPAAQQVQRSLLSPQAAAATPVSPASSPSTATTSSSSTTPTSVPAPVAAAAANRLAVAAAAELAADAGTIRSARASLDGLRSVLPSDGKQVDSLGQDVLVAESSDITEGLRQGLLQAVSSAASKATSQITLPLASSITLTSTKGQIPLTVLAPPALHAHVQLRLTSQRLIFQVFSPPDGHCQVPAPTSEVCELTLATQNTTLKVPVETRASGVFPLSVSLWTPDGSEVLATDRDTVRSTAVSGVGVVLIVLAIVSLAIWWVRDLRHGRRARQLVPAPGEDDDANADADANPNGDRAGGEAVLPSQPAIVGHPGDSDPVVREFFSTPAPDFDQPRPRP